MHWRLTRYKLSADKGIKPQSCNRVRHIADSKVKVKMKSENRINKHDQACFLSKKYPTKFIKNQGNVINLCLSNYFFSSVAECF